MYTHIRHNLKSVMILFYLTYSWNCLTQQQHNLILNIDKLYRQNTELRRLYYLALIVRWSYSDMAIRIFEIRSYLEIRPYIQSFRIGLISVES